MGNIYEGMNVRQKLAKARLQFLNQKVTKSGKNMHLEFMYFELEDIVPPAIRIFARIGLVTEIDFGDQRGAVMRVYNTDNVDEAPMEFCIPYREVSPIVSNAGKEVTNPLQALGSSVTYLRRYLWMAVLDITEPDDIDATLGEPEEEKKEAMSNLLNANKPLFTKRARKEKLMSCGLDFEDIIQIEMLNFIEAINKAIEEGITSFPFEHAFDKYGSKRRIWEGYAPCGVKLSYSTKKRRVADNTYNMQRVTFVEEGTEAISTGNRVEKESSKKCEMLDSELFGSVWKDELHSGLEAVIDGLSDFELGLLLGIVNKLSNVKIAENLGVSESTVRRYIPKMMAKAQTIAKNNGLDAYISDLYK